MLCWRCRRHNSVISGGLKPREAEAEATTPSLIVNDNASFGASIEAVVAIGWPAVQAPVAPQATPFSSVFPASMLLPRWISVPGTRFRI